MPIHAKIASRYFTKGDSFRGRVALKLVITTLVCVKLAIHIISFDSLADCQCSSVHVNTVPPSYIYSHWLVHLADYIRSYETQQNHRDYIHIDIECKY